MKKHRKKTKRAAKLVKATSAILTGKSPDVVGAALLELLAIFIAGHAPDLREEILALHIKAVRELVPVIERERGDPWGEA